MCFASLSMLMNPLKAINSGWQVQIQADVTFNVCMEDVALLGFGVNSMGAKYNLCVLSLIPNSAENKKVYSETWKAVNCALDLLLRNFVRCPMHDCDVCDIFCGITERREIQEILANSIPFKIPVVLAGSDNNLSFANFVAEDLPGTTVLQCFSHLTGNLLHKNF